MMRALFLFFIVFKGVPNVMKRLFVGLSLKRATKFYLQNSSSSMTGMIETLAASHMILKFILNGSLPEN